MGPDQASLQSNAGHSSHLQPAEDDAQRIAWIGGYSHGMETRRGVNKGSPGRWVHPRGVAGRRDQQLS